jgi:hypothetical protein
MLLSRIGVEAHRRSPLACTVNGYFCSRGFVPVAVGFAISHERLRRRGLKFNFLARKTLTAMGKAKGRASILAGEVPRARKTKAVLGADKDPRSSG